LPPGVVAARQRQILRADRRRPPRHIGASAPELGIERCQIGLGKGR